MFCVNHIFHTFHTFHTFLTSRAFSANMTNARLIGFIVRQALRYIRHRNFRQFQPWFLRFLFRNRCCRFSQEVPRAFPCILRFSRDCPPHGDGEWHGEAFPVRRISQANSRELTLPEAADQAILPKSARLLLPRLNIRRSSAA